jgi:tetratricopeptide (TPR) repeat protein
MVPRVVLGLVAVLAAATLLDAQRQSAVELEKAAWQAVRGGRLQEAAETFREALRAEPRDARLLLGAGLAAHLLGQLEEARQHLIAALQAQPSLTEASLLLGQILYQRGDVDGAISVYEQARTAAPNEPLLTSRLEAWRREADLHGRFTQRVGDRFTVLFEGPKEEALAARAVEVLDAAYWRVGTALGAYPLAPITVVLYTQEQFRDITRSPAWAAGAFDGRIRIPVRGAPSDTREFERVLSHEFTHALVHSLAPRNVPQWLDEGLAVAFEVGHDAQAVPRVPASSGAPEPDLPLASLEQSFDGLSANRAQRAYADSAVAVQSLIDLAGMPAILNLLWNIGEGLPFPEAFERATLMSYGEFQKTWRSAAR